MLYYCITLVRSQIMMLFELVRGPQRDCAQLKRRVADENRNQEDRKFRWPSATPRTDAAAGSQTRPGTAHYGTCRRRISGDAVRSRLRGYNGSCRSDYGQVQGHTR